MKIEIEIPDKLIRRTDGEVFALDASDGLYYIEASRKEFPDNLHHGYTYKTLMVDWAGDFMEEDDYNDSTTVTITRREYNELRKK